jgi:hypothetical protein
VSDATERVTMVSLVLQVLAPVAICLVKISVLIMYLRLFGNLRWIRQTCTVGIGILIAYHLAFAIAFGAMCAPPPSEGISQVSLLIASTTKKCTNTRYMVLIMGIGNSLIDLVLLVLPLPTVWNLKMPTREKLKTSAIFLIGIR